MRHVEKISVMGGFTANVSFSSVFFRTSSKQLSIYRLDSTLSKSTERHYKILPKFNFGKYLNFEILYLAKKIDFCTIFHKGKFPFMENVSLAVYWRSSSNKHSTVTTQ